MNPIDPATDETVRLPLAEEVAHVEKRKVASGKVTIRTSTEIHDELVSEALTHEHVEVERVVVDRIVESVPQVRMEGDVTIVPVVEERIVVSKHLVLVEEVRIRRRSEIEQVNLSIPLRRQVARVDDESQVER